MDDLIAEFLTETNESLAELDNDMVQLEQNPGDTDLLSGIFRLMHTIKGTCGFLGLGRLEKVAHKAEDVLGRFRDKELEVTQEYVTLIFESLDTIKWIIGEIEANGEEPPGDDEALIKKLEAAYEGKTLDQAESPEGKEASDQESAVQEVPDEQTQKEGAGEEAEIEALMNAGEDKNEKGEDQAEAEEKEEPAGQAQSAEQEKPEPDQKKEVRESQLSTQTLRVNVDVLEDLMTMVSELVLTRNQLMQIMRTQRESEFSGPLQNLNQVVSELQDGVMKTRMQPIGNAWAKLPRIIRDISIELGKKIDLQMKGQDTELDRQVLEMIKDPLTHMVRNSADHGIERPEDRVLAGKPETGQIVLNAYHEGGHIIIEIKDDGKGLPLDKIKQKAIDSGVASAEEIESMSPHQIQQFIFKAGFSTAEKVTAVSGRGVGMDVVRSNIENIGGSVELNSVEGKGSTFFIKIPLTLAIVSALIVEAASEKFAIPQLAVKELVMATENGKSRIETIKGTPVFRLRDHLLPLVSLQELLKIQKAGAGEARVKKPEERAKSFSGEDKAQDNVVQFQTTCEGAENNESSERRMSDSSKHQEFDGADKPGTGSSHLKSGSCNIDSEYIVVTQVGSYHFGIIVDQVFDTEEIVVKPVSKILRDIDLFSGNTILGDGSVIMILDPAGIAKTTGDIESTDSAESKEEEKTAKYSDSKTSLLLFNAGDKTPKAVPLALIARLENIKLENVEYARDQMLVQYRGKLMPLMPFSENISFEEEAEKPVLVFSAGDKSMGLIVDEILDILEDHIEVQYNSNQPGVLGSAIIREKATDVIDVGYYVQQSDKDWFKVHGDKPFDEKPENSEKKRRVLLVDDSPFFRNMMAPLLSVAGYEVTTQESAKEALDMLEKGASFDVIVSDIEMPDMSGFEFAEQIKSNDDLKQTPLVALSSHATAEDVHRGEEAGFQKYVAKFDRESLLSTIHETIGHPKGAQSQNSTEEI